LENQPFLRPRSISTAVSSHGTSPGLLNSSEENLNEDLNIAATASTVSLYTNSDINVSTPSPSRIITSSGIKVAHLNIRSLRNSTHIIQLREFAN
jgi:homospermidine synthase